ncbi:MAG: ATP-dependent DNA helicase [Methylococcales bacterium]
MTDLETLFGSEGPLAKTIEGYQPRTAQIEMAKSIAATIQKKRHLVAEAGTGTGKTFAYLIPAVLSGKKVVVSTGTKNLQDQLFNKDLPIIRDALAVPFRAALLKGRSNYLCIYRLRQALDSDFGYGRQEASDLRKVSAWSGRTRRGDIAEVGRVSETSRVWSLVTSTADNCLGQECPDYSECYIAKARRKAQDAEIIVVNHHLLCADWSLREGGFGDLLPDYEAIIVDEAHQLAETASYFFGLSLSGRQMIDFAQDVITEHLTDASDMKELRTCADDLELKVKQLRLAFGEGLRKAEWNEFISNTKVSEALSSVRNTLDSLCETLKPAAERSSGLESCRQRGCDMQTRLATLLDDDSSAFVRWFEVYKRSITLGRTPLDITKEFSSFIEDSNATWIFTSATLTVANDFEHFTGSLGLNEADTRDWQSPFDYAHQSIFYHPLKMPEPASPQFIPAVAEAALPVLQASRGRAFFLFTSYSALRGVTEILENTIDYPLMVQGTQPKEALLREFVTHGNAILMGTASFWEGVDVRGPALSCVIIDKFPFASPGDPVMKARLNSIRQKGMEPFTTYQLPEAVIALKQGVGRLIRDVNDRGVLMICDPRLLNRPYGRVFIDSLPPMRRTRSLSTVQKFFAAE